MDFSTVTKIVIPEGEVTKIMSGSTILWQKSSGGVTDYSYSGSTVADELTYLRCHVSELNGSSDSGENLGFSDDFNGEIVDITATRIGTDTSANIISKIENGVVTYYDYDLGDYAETTYRMLPYNHAGSGYIIGIELHVRGYGGDSEPILFDGTYNWSFNVD